jgi:hypothetical protein
VNADAKASGSLPELSSIMVQLLERPPEPLRLGIEGRFGLFPRYVRRKPGRGLAIIYNASALDSSRRGRRTMPERWVTLTLGERSLSVQIFPADDRLPTLAACCDPAPDSPLFSALEEAARVQLGDPVWRLVAASAEPVRYKPGSRCVIRYAVRLANARSEGALQRTLGLFGKVYCDPDRARTIQATMRQLYAEQVEAGEPILPRPLGAVETLGLALTEAVPPTEAAEAGTPRPGWRALRPRFVRGDAGEILDVVVPGDELCVTARALARLHSSAVRHLGALRRGVDEAKSVGQRAALIAAHNPAQADAVQRLARQLATCLEALRPDAYRPAHGGFKASQLLFHGPRVFIVDFDGVCLADPALDVGYFLAYLRPNGLWYDRPGMRRWFDDSAASFVDAYRHSLSERGIDDAVTNGILRRTRFYEAALLFKIAARRANRLNSPRSGELSAMLTEIAHCISEPRPGVDRTEAAVQGSMSLR